MSKFTSISADGPVTELDLDTFNKLIASQDATETPDGEDRIYMTLPEGKWCRLHPGLNFDISRFNRGAAFPGYVKTAPNGCIDIYSESGPTNILITRNAKPSSILGTCTGAEKRFDFGTFESRYMNDNTSTLICYFNHNSYEMPTYAHIESLDKVPHKEPPHVLRIARQSLAAIVSYEEKTAQIFSQPYHWRDAYGRKFDLNDQTKFIYSPLIIAKSEEVNLDKYMPKDVKVRCLVCSTELNDTRNGAVMEFNSGKSKVMNFSDQDETLRHFDFAGKQILVVPKSLNGKLLNYKISSDRLDKNALVSCHRQRFVFDSATNTYHQVGLFKMKCRPAPKPQHEAKKSKCCLPC